MTAPQGPPPPGGYPQQPYPPQPPKKSRGGLFGVLGVFGGVALCLALAVGAVILGIVLVGGAANEAAEDFDSAVSDADEQFSDVATDFPGAQRGEMTLEKFEQIQEGMPKEEVFAITGECELTSQTEIVDTVSESYTCHGTDGFSSALLTFTDNTLSSKSQFGLE